MLWLASGLWVLGNLLPPVLGLSCPEGPDYLNNGMRTDCCRSTGICQSSSCTVFGFKNSAKTNCHTSGINPNCFRSYCKYWNPQCIPSGPSSLTHCYGYVRCTDNSNTCEGYDQPCLEDGSSSNFKICGDDTCPMPPGVGVCPGPTCCPTGYFYDGSKCQRGCPPNQYWDGTSCIIDLCANKSCSAAAREHCNFATGTCDCTDGYMRALDGTCKEDLCRTVTCSAITHEHCNPNTGGCDCNDGWERVNGACIEDLCASRATPCGDKEHCNYATGQCDCTDNYERLSDGSCAEQCPVGWYRGSDLACHMCKECPEHSMWNETTSQCECERGYTRDPVSGNPFTCKPINPKPCVLNGVANIVKQKHGKSEDVIVGKMTIDYIEASNTFTIKYAITNADYSELKFKKVWPRLRSRAPKDHTNPRYDDGWNREYTKDNLPTREVVFVGISVPDFLCAMAPDVKNLYLSTQLQFWEPNNGNGNFRAANGYVDDGDVKTGRDRRDYRLLIQCVLDASQCAACSNQCLGTGQHCVLNTDGVPTCQCDAGYQEATDGSGTCVAEDACSLNGEICPDNSYCQDLKPGARCKCNPGYHERKHSKDGSMECVRKCMMNGATALKVVGGGIAGKLDIILNDASPAEAPQYALIYTLTNGQMKSLYFQTGKNRMQRHIPSLFLNSVVLTTPSNTLRYPADGSWLTLDNPVDCSPGAENVFYVSAHVGMITNNVGQKGWAKGKKTDDANAQDFEFRVKCHTQCPQVANCHNCHNNAECVWDHTSANDNKYTCKCNPGYTGDGIACTDIDECAVGLSTVCGANSACVNTAGSYTCSCTSRNVYDGILGCVAPTTTLRAAEGVVAEATIECSTPSWAWIVMGLLVTGLVIGLSVVAVQFSMARRSSRMYSNDPHGGHVDGPTPSNFVSPSGMRRRPGP